MSKKLLVLIKNIKVQWLNRIFIVLSVVVIIASFGYYLSKIHSNQHLIKQNLLEKQLVTARAASKMISALFEFTGKSIVMVEKELSLDVNKDDPRNVLEHFVESFHGTPVTGIFITDSQGLVTSGVSDGGQIDIGEDVSDREYFNWAKTAKEGDVYLGKSLVSKFGVTKGRYIVPIATPYIVDGEFIGVVTAGVYIDRMSQNYLDGLKQTKDTAIILINSEGYYISSPFTELDGKNIFDFIKNSPIKLLKPISELASQALLNPSEGKVDISSFSILGIEGKSHNYDLVSYVPVMLGNRHWVLIVATPADNNQIFLDPFHLGARGIFIFILTIVLGFSLFCILAIRIAQRDSYIKGFIEGRDEIIKVALKTNSKVKK